MSDNSYDPALMDWLLAGRRQVRRTDPRYAPRRLPPRSQTTTSGRDADPRPYGADRPRRERTRHDDTGRHRPAPDRLGPVRRPKPPIDRQTVDGHREQAGPLHADHVKAFLAQGLHPSELNARVYGKTIAEHLRDGQPMDWCIEAIRWHKRRAG